MFLNCTVQPEVTAFDPFAPVLAGVRRAPVVVVDADGRLRIEVDLDEETGLFEGVHLPHLGVTL